MSEALDRWNSLPRADAERELMTCCGSRRWARTVTARRPLASLPELRSVADEIWWQIGEDDWLEAFSHHPRIGECASAAATATRAATWSGEEQSRVAAAEHEVRERLREGNEAYERRFGHVYIVCAAGRSAEELLAMLEQRMANDSATELRVAAEEQRKITHLRMERLFDS